MRRTAVTVFALIFAACNSEKTSGPSGPVEAVSLDVCGLRPTWLGIQNEGDVWTQVTIPTSGPITFDATERVSIAMAITFLGNITLITNVTRDEIDSQQLNLFGCDELTIGDRELSGTISGLSTSDLGSVAAGELVTYAFTNNQEWIVGELLNAPTDVVAARYTGASPDVIDRVIVRRNQSPQTVPSTPLPVLNFAATEAVAPELAAVTVSGVGSDYSQISGRLITTNGTSATLTDKSIITDATLDYYSIPASLRLVTDIHELNVVAEDNAGTGLRDVTKWYQVPSATTLALGPAVSSPTVSQVSASPVLRMKALLNGQGQYPSAAAVVFTQTSGDFTDFRFVFVLTSAGFLGTSSTTWDLTTPDLSAAGYQAAWGLKPAQPVDWQVTAFNGSGVSLFGAGPVIGATVSSATRYSPSFDKTARFGNAKRQSLRVFGTPILRQPK